MGWAKWLLKNYLFVRVPLVRPDPWLGRALPYLRFIYTPGFFWITLAAGLVGLILAGRQWDVFRTTFLHFFTLEGAVLAGLTLFFTKVIHELGHAFTAKRHGVRVASMGVALLVLFPMLYTVTHPGPGACAGSGKGCKSGRPAWAPNCALACYAPWPGVSCPTHAAQCRLHAGHDNLDFDAGRQPQPHSCGLMAISCCPTRSTWPTCRIVPLPSPAGICAKPCSPWARRRRNRCRTGCSGPDPLCLCRLIYRFFLFLGIALLVYHFFFKLLGIFLFVVEIVWFIGLPIWRELTEWHKRRTGLRWTPTTIRTGLLALLGLALLLLPWNSTVRAPALLRGGPAERAYCPHRGKTAVHARTGPADPGRNPAVPARRSRSRPPAGQRRAGADTAALAANSFLAMDRAAAASLRVVREDFARRPGKACGPGPGTRAADHPCPPLTGRWQTWPHPLLPGEWVSDGEWLGTLASPGPALVEAFVDERDLERLMIGNEATFIAEAGGWDSVPLRLATLPHRRHDTVAQCPRN